MSNRDEPDSFRLLTGQLLEKSRSRLGLSPDALRRVIASPAHRRTSADSARYHDVASLADSVMSRRPLTNDFVDAFYTRARIGQRGETLFTSGDEALRAHGYPTDTVAGLPSEATSRFLGIGNVWSGVTCAAGGRVIDVGCGSGVDIAVACATMEPTLAVGIDKRSELFQVAQNACPRAAFVIGDIKAPPVADNSFDLVLANGLPPLQRPGTLLTAARRLHSIATRHATISATVIVASPALVARATASYPDESIDFVCGLATLVSGKPSARDVVQSFGESGSVVTLHPGSNPYRDATTRERTSMITVNAVVD